MALHVFAVLGDVSSGGASLTRNMGLIACGGGEPDPTGGKVTSINGAFWRIRQQTECFEGPFSGLGEVVWHIGPREKYLVRSG